MNYHFITVEGNIGAGKTTLAHLLSKHFNARLVLEEFADNPFLAKFYENPAQYSQGIDWVLVNGKAVVADGKPTNALPGRILRGPGYKAGTP